MMIKKFRENRLKLGILIIGIGIFTGCGADPESIPVEKENPTEKENAGEMNTDITVDTEWGNGGENTDDQTGGRQEQFYYNYITEATLNAQAHTPELAVSGNIVFAPTGSWSRNGVKNLVINYWNVETKQKMGTLPIPAELNGSYHYMVHALFCADNLLFVAHGEDWDINRVEVYDISDISDPRHVTYIGGTLSWKPGMPAEYDAFIGIPYAIWAKDGKLVLIDDQRVAVYNVTDLTEANAGNIKPVKYMLKETNAADRVTDQAGFVSLSDGNLYVTNPDPAVWGELRRIDWDNVVSPTTGIVTDLIDYTGTLLRGVKLKKAIAFDGDHLLAFDNNLANKTYSVTYYEPVGKNGTDASVFFKPTTATPLNALHLKPQPDGKERMIISLPNKKIAIVRIDKIFLSDF